VFFASPYKSSPLGPTDAPYHPGDSEPPARAPLHRREPGRCAAVPPRAHHRCVGLVLWVCCVGGWWC
jgi:hypothetical protein